MPQKNLHDVKGYGLGLAQVAEIVKAHVKSFQSGGNDFLKKPFSLEELIGCIENLLSLSNRQNLTNKEEIAFGKFIFYPNKLRDNLKADPNIQIITIKGIGYYFSIS